MKSLGKVGGVAALGLMGTALPVLAGGTEPADLMLGTWNLEQAVEGCRDVTGKRLGELWSFAPDGRFTRVAADGLSSQSGRWALRFEDRQLELVVDASGQRRVLERFPIVLLDGKRLELLSPTDVQKGLVIRQERVVSFFHS